MRNLYSIGVLSFQDGKGEVFIRRGKEKDLKRVLAMIEAKMIWGEEFSGYLFYMLVCVNTLQSYTVRKSTIVKNEFFYTDGTLVYSLFSYKHNPIVYVLKGGDLNVS